MEVEEATCLWLLYRRREKAKAAKKIREFWIHPSISNRLTHGHFVTLYPKLRENASQFREYFKMSINTFDNLVALTRDQITSVNSCMRECLSAEEKLVMTIRYLTSGCSFRDLHDEYKIGTSTGSVMVRQVCGAVLSILGPTFMPKPTEEIWKKNEIEFSEFDNFPNCIGVVDGKCIKILRSKNMEIQQINRKNNCTVTLFAICDYKYRFVSANVKSQSCCDEPAAFKDSLIFKKLNEESFDIPDPKPISSVNSKSLPHVLVGGEALPLMENLMKRYGLKKLTPEKTIFNDRLLRVKRRIDVAFGILVNKWQILCKTISVNEDFAKKIVKACCILHNFVLVRDGHSFEETLYGAPLPDFHHPRKGKSSNAALLTRDAFTQYFLNDGRVEWLERKAEDMSCDEWIKQ